MIDSSAKGTWHPELGSKDESRRRIASRPAQGRLCRLGLCDCPDACVTVLRCGQRSCASAPRRTLVMVMEKLRQLLAQAFIPFGLVAEQDSSLEQGLLKLARKLAPQIEGSQS